MSQLNLNEAQIRETAYLFWLEEGKPHGKDREHWSKAVELLTPAKPIRTRRPPAKTAGARKTVGKTTKPKSSTKASKPKAAN